MTTDILGACDEGRKLKAKKFKDLDRKKVYQMANGNVKKEIRFAKEKNNTKKSPRPSKTSTGNTSTIVNYMTIIVFIIAKVPVEPGSHFIASLYSSVIAPMPLVI